MATATAPAQTNESLTITLPVLGMSCAACQVHVEQVLRETPGVAEAAVNLMTSSARIRLTQGTDAALMPATLVQAIRDSGYESELAGPTASGPAKATQASHPAARRPEEGFAGLRALVALTCGAVLMLASVPLMSTPAHGLMASAAGVLYRILPWLFAMPRAPLSFGLMALTLAGMVWAGGSIYARAWTAARHGTSNMHTLVAIGTLAAFLYSAASTIAPGFFLTRGLSPEIYYDSVLLILGFLLLGNWLDLRAKRRTLDALRGFAALRPETATVLRNGVEVHVPAAEVATGEVVVIRPGERLSVDGVVLEGTSSVDESLLTGESHPVVRTVGDTVIGGSLNYDGMLHYRVTSVGASSMLGRIIALIESAQASKAPMQQLADRVSGVFVPVVLGIATLTFAVWTFATGDPGRAVAVAIAVLVIACPCAMGLAVPAALTVAIGRAAQLGVLFKSGEALERLAGVDTVVFDKTGTLTEGKPCITGIMLPGALLAGGAGVMLPGAETLPEGAAHLVRIAASLEHGSEHPLAAAVLAYAAEHGVQLEPASEIQARPGRGITGRVEGSAAAAGNGALMAELQIPLPQTGALGNEGTLLHVAAAGIYLGTLIAEDTLREGAAAAIAALHRMALRTIMLTGDSAGAAEAVAKAAGIIEFEAAMLPAAKLARIVALQAEGHKVAMVGDGINDAAALTQADAGLAIGTGTGLARDAGDAILLRGDPAEVVKAIAIARHARGTMRQNLGWALGYNLLGIPLAAGVLYPFTGLLLNPGIAAAAMAMSSVSVLANSLRLRYYSPEIAKAAAVN